MKASTRIEIGSGGFGRWLIGACLLAATCVTAPARAEGSVKGAARGEGSVTGTARAESNNGDSERANLLFKKGKLAFNAGKYADALRIYSEAWHLKQSPDIAANLAQTEAELGNHRDAAEHFAFALAHLLPSSTDEQKNALAEGLEIEKMEVGTLHVTLEPADAAFSIDDTQLTLPTNGDVFVEPGDHRTTVTHEGYDANQQTVHVSKGSAQVLWIRLLEVGMPPAAPASDVPARPDLTDAPPPKVDEASARSVVPALIGGGLVLAGSAVGVAFLLSTNSRQNDANQLGDKLSAEGGANACGAKTPFGSDCAALHDDNQSIDRSRLLEVTGFVVAGAAALGSAAYLLWPQSNASTARRLTPAFAVVPGAAALGITGSF